MTVVRSVRGRSAVVLRWGPGSIVYDRRVLGRTVALLVLVLVVSAFSLTQGPITIEPSELVRVLTGGGSETSRLVVLEWRLPRIVMALAAGSALGAAGALVQSITRNPLGSPDVIGFSAGSYFAVALVVVVFDAPVAVCAPAAIMGGLLAAVAVWLLAYRRGVSPFRLILVGIGVTSLLTGLSSWLTLISSQEQFTAVLFWGAGSLSGLHWPGVLSAAAGIALVLAVTSLLTRPVGQLELGDVMARTGGVDVGRTRPAALGLAIVLVALVTAVCGPIEFVALAAPQLARRIVGRAGISLLPSIVVGSLIVVAADLVGDELLPAKIPAGVITLVLGGGYLLLLLFREKRRA